MNDALEPADVGMIFKALAFAARKHNNQRRKDHLASPYINHPIALANVLCNEGAVHDAVTLCGAILHDTLEDTQTTAAELGEHFGEAVRDVVLEVTDDTLLPKAERRRLQIVHAATISDRAKLVKLADKICNLRDMANAPPAEWSLRRRQEYFDWAKQVIEQLRGIHPRLEGVFDETYAQRPK